MVVWVAEGREPVYDIHIPNRLKVELIKAAILILNCGTIHKTCNMILLYYILTVPMKKTKKFELLYRLCYKKQIDIIFFFRSYFHEYFLFN
jgi:hypothetical protein